MTPGQEHMKVSDEYLMKRIDDLGKGIEDKMDKGFSTVEDKFQSVVTRGEHTSTVARLETEISHVKEQVNDRMAHVEEKVDYGFASQESREKDRDARAARRIGWAISIAAIAPTITFSIINIVIQ